MMLTGRMVYLTAVTLQDYSRQLSRELLRLGLMHFVDIRTIDPVFNDPKTLSAQKGDSEPHLTVLSAARRRIETILSVGGYPRPTVGSDEIGRNERINNDDVQRMAESFEKKIDKIRDGQRSIQQQIHRLEDVRRHMGDAKNGRFQDTSGISKGGAFLQVQTGSVPSGKLESLEQKISLYPAMLSRVGETEDRIFVLVIGMKRNKADLNSILNQHGFQAQEIPEAEGENTVKELDTKLAELKQEQSELGQSVLRVVGEGRGKLDQVWRDLRVQELERSIQSRFAETKRAVVASGWIPESKRNAVQAGLLKATEGHISLEWHEAVEFQGKLRKAGKKGSENKPDYSNVKVPSRLANPGFLGPFQRLVTNYGIPAYNTMDPTIIVAVAYLAMFGLMFGDAGHGLVLILVGLAGRIWTKKRENLGAPATGIAASIPSLSKLILWCGAAAIVAGVLFGSYFGMGWLPPLWFNYHGVVAGHVEAGPIESIFDVLKITIYFGITVIGLGLVMNWVNLFRQKRWLSLIFDNSGILGGIIYAAGVVIASQFVSSGYQSLPNNPVLFILVIAPALILFLKAPLTERGGNPLMWLMDWMINLLEIFAGYLANTLSFMRVAGLGIAHVTLMIAFFQIAKMASPEGFNIWAILIMILGNAIVIVLEGLSAGIQSLRLNYYEFFSKHFQPSGVEYKPISLEEK